MVTEPIVSGLIKPELENAVEPGPPASVVPNGFDTLLAVIVRPLADTMFPLAAVVMFLVVAPVLVSGTFNPL